MQMSLKSQERRVEEHFSSLRGDLGKGWDQDHDGPRMPHERVKFHITLDGDPF